MELESNSNLVSSKTEKKQRQRSIRNFMMAEL